MNSPALELHRSVLKELGNIGAGHATTALAEIMGLQLGLTETQVDSLPLDRKTLQLRRGDRNVAALQMSVFGDAPAEMVVVFDQDESIAFVKRFLAHQIGDVELNDDIIHSALREIANIIGGSYLTAIVDMIGIELLPSTPTLRYGRLDDIVGAIAEAADLDRDNEAFLINNGFINERGAINVEFLLMPNDGSLESYLQAFGIVP